MRTKEIKVYKITELERSARDRAMCKIAEWQVSDLWWIDEYDYFIELGKEKGIILDAKKPVLEFDLDRDWHIHLNIDRLDVEKLLQQIDLPKGSNHLKTYILENATTDRVRYTNGHTKTRIVIDRYRDKSRNPKVEAILSEIEEKLDQVLQDFASDCLNSLQKQYEYLTSEEAIIETCEANEYEFDESGRII